MTIPPSDDQRPSGAPKQDDPAARRKIEPKISLKKGGKADDLLGFAKENTKDTIAYVFLIVGFLLLFFEPLYGGTIMGVLLGLYFTGELVSFWKKSHELINEWGMVKTLVLAGIALIFFRIKSWMRCNCDRSCRHRCDQAAFPSRHYCINKQKRQRILAGDSTAFSLLPGGLCGDFITTEESSLLERVLKIQPGF